MEFNDDGLKRAVQEGVDEHRKAVQPAIDRFCKKWDGRPADQVKPALKAEFRRHGLELGAATLTDLARRVSNGDRIVLK